jgi:hypothetical protein
LNERYGSALPDADWQHKNRSVGRPFIEHTIAIADTHSALTVACRMRPEIALIDAKALVADFPRPPLTPDRAFLWKTEVCKSRSNNPSQKRLICSTAPD